MDAERDELRRLVEELTDDQVAPVLADLRRRVRPPAPGPWPPPWFGAIQADDGRSLKILGVFDGPGADTDEASEGRWSPRGTRWSRLRDSNPRPTHYECVALAN